MKRMPAIVLLLVLMLSTFGCSGQIAKKEAVEGIPMHGKSITSKQDMTKEAVERILMIFENGGAVHDKTKENVRSILVGFENDSILFCFDTNMVYYMVREPDYSEEISIDPEEAEGTGIS